VETLKSRNQKRWVRIKEKVDVSPEVWAQIKVKLFLQVY